MSKTKSNKVEKAIQAKHTEEQKQGTRLLRAPRPSIGAFKNPRLWGEISDGGYQRVALATTGC